MVTQLAGCLQAFASSYPSTIVPHVYRTRRDGAFDIEDIVRFPYAGCCMQPTMRFVCYCKLRMTFPSTTSVRRYGSMEAATR